jgi:hypothetical protein
MIDAAVFVRQRNSASGGEGRRIDEATFLVLGTTFGGEAVG